MQKIIKTKQTTTIIKPNRNYILFTDNVKTAVGGISDLIGYYIFL